MPSQKFTCPQAPGLRAWRSTSLQSMGLALLAAQSIPLVAAEPSQYCRFGHDAGEVDFCVAVSSYRNHTTAAHDLYVNFQVTRPSSSFKGWNAIGTGPTMAGSLMFIVYGDPLSGQSPTASARTVTAMGHPPPRPVTSAEAGPTDVQIIHSQWMSTEESSQDPATFVASVGAVCYGCSQWPGSPINFSGTSQPWMWAWNDRQDMSLTDYAPDARLDMHNFGAGGWGLFYVDMEGSVGHASSLPQVQRGVGAVGASTFPTQKLESPLSPSKSSWLVALGKLGLGLGLVHLHALLMGLAFLVLFPLGVVAVHWGSSGAFRYHWVLQLLGALSTTIGAVVALAMSGSHGPTGAHQVAGTVIVLLLWVQAGLGLRHHLSFVRSRHRTWASKAHIWLGRCVVVGGLGNLLGGMVTAGHTKGAGLGLVCGLVVLVAAAVSTSLYVAKRPSRLATVAIGAWQDEAPASWTEGHDARPFLEDDQCGGIKRCSLQHPQGEGEAARESWHQVRHGGPSQWMQ